MISNPSKANTNCKAAGVMTFDLNWFVPFLGTVAALAAFFAARYQLRSADFERRLRITQEEIKEIRKKHQIDLELVRPFISSTSYVDYVENDVIVLGPQTAGKTALVKYWTSFWEAHLGMASTPQFELYEFVFPKFYTKDKYRKILDIDVNCQVHAKLKIWDYGGEVKLVEDAIKKIGRLARVTLVFVISSEPEHMRRNEEYYSTSFNRRMDKMMKDTNGKTELVRVLVVFSKIDLLPPASRNLEFLQDKYDNCLHRLRLIFDDVSIYPLSGETGEGVVAFLQEISSIYVDEEGVSKLHKTAKEKA